MYGVNYPAILTDGGKPFTPRMNAGVPWLQFYGNTVALPSIPYTISCTIRCGKNIPA